MRTPIKLSAIAAILCAAPASAEDSTVLEKIEGRIAYCRLLTHNLNLLHEMTEHEGGYDAEESLGIAANLQALAAMDLGPIWAQGSDNVSMRGKTRFLPVASTHHSDLADGLAELRQQTELLARDAAAGRFTLRLTIEKVEGACSGCHASYRAEDF